MKIQVHSRIGNGVIGVLGAIYTVAAIALFAVHVRTTWNAAGLIDYAVALVLMGSAAAGIFFILTAAQNLELPLRHREAPPHRAAAAAGR